MRGRKAHDKSLNAMVLNVMVCFTPYQRLRLYNVAPLVAFYDTLGIRRTYSRLKPPAPSRGNGIEKMITFKFVRFTLAVYVSLKVNVLVTDIILNIMSQEHLIFTS